MRKLVVLLSVFMVLMLALAACGGDDGASNDASDQGGETGGGDATAGKTAFDGTCTACHGPDAKGLPNLGKDLTTSDFVSGQSDQDLLAFVKQGRSVGDPANTTGVDMPPKGGNPALTDQQILDIIAYLRTLEE
jgi:mono/diheme cytochrome c family protein